MFKCRHGTTGSAKVIKGLDAIVLLKNGKKHVAIFTDVIKQREKFLPKPGTEIKVPEHENQTWQTDTAQLPKKITLELFKLRKTKWASLVIVADSLWFMTVPQAEEIGEIDIFTYDQMTTSVLYTKHLFQATKVKRVDVCPMSLQSLQCYSEKDVWVKFHGFRMGDVIQITHNGVDTYARITNAPIDKILKSLK